MSEISREYIGGNGSKQAFILTGPLYYRNFKCNSNRMHILKTDTQRKHAMELRYFFHLLTVFNESETFTDIAKYIFCIRFRWKSLLICTTLQNSRSYNLRYKLYLVRTFYRLFYITIIDLADTLILGIIPYSSQFLYCNNAF